MPIKVIRRQEERFCLGGAEPGSTGVSAVEVGTVSSNSEIAMRPIIPQLALPLSGRQRFHNLLLILNTDWRIIHIQ